jgi:hypothetical protein
MRKRARSIWRTDGVGGEWGKVAGIPTVFLETLSAVQAAASAEASALSKVGAAELAGDAEKSRVVAELAALAAGATIYASEAEDLAATPMNKVFIVHSGAVTQVFKAASDSAIFLGNLFDRSDFLQGENNLSDLGDPAAALLVLGAASSVDVDAKLPKAGGVIKYAVTLPCPFRRDG